VHTILQVGFHRSRAEGQNHLPRPAGHPSFDAAQDTVGLLGCRCTLLRHVELLVNQYSQVLLLRAALLFSMCLSTVSRRILFMILQGTEVSLTGL